MPCFQCVDVDEYLEYILNCFDDNIQCAEFVLDVLRSSELRILRYLKSNGCVCTSCDDIVKEAIYIETYYVVKSNEVTDVEKITEEAYNFLFIKEYLYG